MICLLSLEIWESLLCQSDLVFTIHRAGVGGTARASMSGIFKGFSRKDDALPDFTGPLRNPKQFNFGDIGALGLPAEVAAVAHDPLQGLVCVSTKAGSLHLYGGPVRSHFLSLPCRIYNEMSPAAAIIDMESKTCRRSQAASVQDWFAVAISGV